MWSLLKKMMTLLSQFGLSFQELIEIVRDLLKLPMPPSIKDEKDFRTWVCDVLHSLVGIAEKTPTIVDDSILKMIDDAVENDDIWPLIYKLLMLVSQRDSNMRKTAAATYGDTIPGTALEMKIARDIISACDPGVTTEDEVVGAVEEGLEITDPNTVVTLAVGLYELYTETAKSYGGIDEGEGSYREEDTALPEQKKPVKKKAAKRKAKKPETGEDS